MKYKLILISIISLFCLNIYSSEQCSMENIFKSYYEGDYKKLFEILKEYFLNCKDDCDFIKHYIFFYSSSNDENFDKIKNFDLSKYTHCFKENSKAKKIFELRLKKDKERENNFQCESFDEVNSFIYCRNSKNLLEKIKYNKDGKFFGNVMAAYFLYLNGYLAEAKEIAIIYYNHALQPNKDENNAFFNNGTLEVLLLDMMVYKILNKYPSEKQRMLIDKAFEYFPYYFKIYFKEEPF